MWQSTYVRSIKLQVILISFITLRDHCLPRERKQCISVLEEKKKKKVEKLISWDDHLSGYCFHVILGSS